MRVLQLSTHDVSGGAERVAMSLHEGFRRRGHDAVLAVGTRWTEEPGVVAIDNLAARGFAGRIERAALGGAARLTGAPARAVHAAGLALQPRRLADRLRGHEDFEMPASRRLLDLPPRRPDVVHAHNLHGGYFDLRELAPLSAAVPTFLTLHDMWTLTGHCAYSLGCERWRDGCGRCPDLTIYPALLRDATRFNLARKRAIYRGSRLRVAVPSRWLLEKARASVLAEGVLEWRLLPYGVDLSVFNEGDRAAARARLGIATDTRVVMYATVAGHTNPFKDYQTADQAVRSVSQRTRGGPVLFLVLGAPSEGPARENTRYLPFIRDRAALADHYRAADLFLHAAVEDNFPNTVLESQACGTPVIATAIGGIPEEIDDGSTGLLVPARGAAEMADAMLALLEDGSRLRAMRGRAASFIQERFDLESQLDRYLEWFSEAIEADVSDRRRAPT